MARGRRNDARPKVSLVATVKDVGPALEPFLMGVRAQTRPPDEIVIVDGGSRDGTAEALRAAEDVTLVEEPKANIAMGRNVAVKSAAHDLIAVTDGDCMLAPDWLERIVRPLEDGADVAMGFYRPAPRSFLEACSAAVSLPDVDEVDPDRFLPSARSVAFRRSALEAVGGYPEWLEVGEDMYVNHRWREAGMRMEFVPGAVAYWRPRPTLRATWSQYERYARGDAEAGMHPERHAARFLAYAAGIAAMAEGRRWPRLAVAAAGAWYARKPIRRAWRLFRGRPTERAASVAVVPALMAFSDAAKMAGYLRGLLAARISSRG